MQKFTLIALQFVVLFLFKLTLLQAQTPSFTQSELNGVNFNFGLTSLMYGPDGRLYAAEYPSGAIKAITVQRNSEIDYEVSSIETLDGITTIQDHNDDGTLHTAINRQVTGLTITGTDWNPVVYVSSSDVRIGAGSGGGNGDVNLDTNSGVITRFTWNGALWDVVDLVRGLPRSEENHATNGLEFTSINGTDYLILATGGFTNAGGPSTNFVYTNEYALSGAVLSIDLDAINALPVLSDNGRSYIYDLPTLDDPTRANTNGIVDSDHADYDGVDVNDPFGGNDGLNQAMIVSGGPVQIFSPGYRNAYDLVVTENNALYVTDNGANGGWGGFPVNEGGGSVTNNYDPNEPGSQSMSGNEMVDNLDHLELVTTNLQNYVPGSFYGGHPNPTRANPFGAGLYTASALSGNIGAEFRTLIYDPDGSKGAGYTTDSTIGLPANWPPVAVANSIEGDWRGPGTLNPDGPNDEPIAIWGTNTNGIDEYTASNFDGVMQGDLLAGHSGGNIRRVQLTIDGDLQNLNQSFLSGIGGNALGITCNSDSDIFPGTIWAGTLNGKIVVFEPSDAVLCIHPEQVGYDASADYDNDGYTNQDEEDNGSDPCNAGSQPEDFDKSVGGTLISDRNDVDDDADGILDFEDPFQLGNPNTSGSDAFLLPVNNDLFNDQQGLGGIFGLGMTGLMNNGDVEASWLDWIDRKDDPNDPNPNDVLGGAAGLMTSHMTSGTALGSVNSQEKGYQYGVQTSTSTGQFTVTGNLIGLTGPLRIYGNTAAVGGELGYFIGDGSQSNYIKIVLTTAGITALQEIDDVVQTPLNVSIPIANRPNSSMLFYFVVDPISGQVDLEYSFDGGSRNAIGTVQAEGSILGAIQQMNQDLAVGLIGTSNTSGVELEGTWDFLKVSQNNTDFALRVNAGGASIVYNEASFLADQSFTGGALFENSNALVPALYQTERSSSSKIFQYDFPLANGNYTVILHFAEIYWGANGGGIGGIGKRIFDVSIEEALVLNDYDIYADVGADTPVLKMFPVAVSDGILNINFSALSSVGGVDQPKIAAIEIVGITVNEAPFAIAEASTLTPDAPLEISFTGSNSTDDKGIVSYVWDFGDGNTSIAQNPEHSYATIGSYSASLTVSDEEGLTHTAELAVDILDTNDFSVFINSGGPLVVYEALAYQTDDYFSGGAVFNNTSALVPELYQTERSSPTAQFAYAIPVSDGNYVVKLHFADIYFGATGGGAGGVGSRVFDVSLEGNIILNDYDIIADVGSETPVVKTFEISISDGEINLEFDALGIDGVDQPKISAIEILTGGQFSPITVEPIADQTDQVGALIGNLGIAASGGDSNSNFSYSISGQPAGILVEPTNGLIYGTIENSALTGGLNNDGVHQVSVSVAKPNSSTVNIDFTWTVAALTSCTWNELSDSSLGRFETLSQAVGDKLYVIGGFEKGVPFLSISAENEIYDTTTDTWSIGAPIPTPVTHMGGAVVGEEIWSVGGFVGNDPGPATNIVQIYNTLTNTWRTGPSLPSVAAGGALTLNANKLHFFGGLEADRQTNTGNHYVLDLANSNVGWSTAAPLPNPRNHLSGVSIEGIIYAIGGQFGHDGFVQDTKLLHAYDAATNQWTPLADLPFERSHFEPGTSVYNGKIIIVGGRQVNQFFDEVTQYDPQTNTWTEICKMPEKLLAPSAKIFNNRLIVSGGGIDGIINFSKSTRWLQLEPDVSQNTWTDKDENQNYTGRHECNFVQVGNQFYLLGGRESDLVERYDYTSDTWTALGSAPKTFSHFQALEYQGLLWVIGAVDGNNYPNDIVDNHIWVYNPLADEWAQGPEIPSGRVRGAAGALVYNNKFYVVGGNTNGHAGGYVSWFDEFDPATGIWTALTDAPRARDHFHAVLVGNELFAIGGRQSGAPTDATQTAAELGKPLVAEVDVYNFSTAQWSTRPTNQNIPTPRAGAASVNFNAKIVIIGGEVYQETVDGVLTTGALKVAEEFDPSTGLWSRFDDMNFARHGHQAIVSGNGIHAIAGSPNYGGGIQKNMEYYGSDNPIGSAVTLSGLSAPSNLVFQDNTVKDISLEVSEGDTGIWVRSFTITGSDASDFMMTTSIISNILLKANSINSFGIQDTGTGGGRNAVLTIEYGASSSLQINLSTAVSCAWNDIADSNLGRFETRSEKVGDKLYILGGWLPGILVAEQVEIYDTLNDTWVYGTPMPIPVTHMGSAVVGSDIWIIGGFTGDDANPGPAVTAVQIYNTITDTWSAGPDLPNAIASGASTTNGNKIHYFGGLLADRQTDTGDHYVLDLANIEAGWVTATPLPNPRNHHSAESVNGVVYAIGGQFGHDTSTQDTKLLHGYDPATDQWTKLSDLPEERSHFEPGTSVHNGDILIVGGRKGSSFFNEITQYDPQLNVWTELCVLPENLMAPVAHPFGDRLIVSSGGVNGTSNLTLATRWLQLATKESYLPITVDPIVNQFNLEAEDIISIPLTANNGNPYDIYTFEISGQPSGISIDAVNGTISGTIGQNAASAGVNNDGIYTVTITANKLDSQGATLQFEWTVTEATTGLIWFEDFENLPNGATSDNGDTAWAAVRDAGRFEVSNGSFLTNGNSASPGVWTSEVIAVSGTISISVDVDDADNRKEPADFVNAYYVLDGGPQVLFGSVSDDISAQTLTVSGLSGATVQIIITADVSTTNEFYTIDNISVFGESIAITEYDLIVNKGSGDGSYEVGASVNISADVAPSGQEFDIWTGDVSGIFDVNTPSTTMAIPASNTAVTATYRDIPTVGVVWLEDFEDLSNGATSDTGATAWTSFRDSGTFEVSNGSFLTNGNSSAPGVWTSEVIPINGTISIAVDVDDADNNKEPADFVKAYYILDGGPQVLFGSVNDDISAQTFTVSGLSGSTLQIIIASDVSTTTEFYTIDNITVFGSPTGITEYDLTVDNGNGDGAYEAGTVVNISADAAPEGQEFDIWTGDISGVSDVNSAATTITMQASNTLLTANYSDIQTGGIVWFEDFEDLSNGATSDTGATAWTSIRDAGTFEVSNGIFLTSGNSASPGEWTSEIIPISGTITLSVDVDDADNRKEPADFVNAYYVLDGGPQVLFGSVNDDISAQTFTVSGLLGTTVQIIIASDVSTTNEFYTIDNIRVFDEGSSARSSNTRFDSNTNEALGNESSTSSAIQNAEDQIDATYLYPNPASDFIGLRLSNAAKEVLYMGLYDLAGKLVVSFDKSEIVVTRDGVELPIQNVRNGIYVVQIHIENSETLYLKVVLEN